MKINRRKRLVLEIAVALCVASGAAFFAQSQLASTDLGKNRPTVNVAMAANVVRDKQQIALDQAGQVQSGETLVWTINSKNEGATPANKFRVVGQIPAGTEFVANTAKTEAASNITYSIDNGKTFVTQPTIPQRQADGTVRQVPAPVSMYTQVRYEWTEELGVGNTVAAEYQVRVR